MCGYVQRQSNQPVRDRLIILLSVRAGLRAAEISKLTWPMVLDDRGRIGDTMVVRDHIAKRQGGRNIPVHAELRAALRDLRTEQGETAGPVIRSLRGGPMQPNSIVNWFVALFAVLQIEGCSSHSGRRTFITQAARNAHRAGCSLRDVQLLAGHRSIETTQRYIDGHTEGQRKLIGLL
jgi:integrase/recombinase XerD